MPKKINAKQLALTFAAWSAVFMLALGTLAKFGIYTGAAQQMVKWHLFFSPTTFTGIIGGAIEAAVLSYLLVYVFVWLYNWVGKKV